MEDRVTIRNNLLLALNSSEGIEVTAKYDYSAELTLGNRRGFILYWDWYKWEFCLDYHNKTRSLGSAHDALRALEHMAWANT